MLFLIKMQIISLFINKYIYIYILQTVKRVHEQSDLERIQDVFPNDFLRLYDKEALTMVSLTIFQYEIRYYIICTYYRTI